VEELSRFCRENTQEGKLRMGDPFLDIPAFYFSFFFGGGVG